MLSARQSQRQGSVLRWWSLRHQSRLPSIPASTNVPQALALLHALHPLSKLRRNLPRVLAGSVAAALLIASPCRATPLDEPFVGGIGFSGPTTGDLTSVYWNPAALSLLTGTEVLLSGIFRETRTTVQRAPGAMGTAFPSAQGSESLSQRPWAPGPGGFLGVGANVLGRFTLAVAGYWPSYERITYRPSSDGILPTRHHGIDLDLRNFALVPALAIRLGKYMHLGFAPGFLFASGQFTFDDDTDINQGLANSENPMATARYKLSAGTSAFAPSPAYTLGAGIHYKRDAWSIGASYNSRAFGNEGDGVRLSIRNGSLAREGQPSPCPPSDNAPCLNGELSYRLPDAVVVGATWQMNERWSFTGIGRYQTFSVHDRIVITLAAPAGSGLGENGVRGRIVLHRGFSDRVELRGNVIRHYAKRARVGAGLRMASSAVPRSQVTPIAVDGFTIEPHIMGEFTFQGFTFQAGYAFAFVPDRTVTNSAFDTSNAAACKDTGYDLSSPVCSPYSQGRQRPSANGRYSHFSHSLSLSLVARF